MKLFILALFIPVFILGYNTVNAQSKEDERIEKAIEVLRAFGDMNDGIPQNLLEVCNGIMIVPGMINAGFVVGGKRGRGLAMIKNSDGTWSDPLFVTITGGSVGFQIGVQAVDLVLVFKSRKTLEEMGNGTFTLGGDLSATAGPVGRSGTATTDYKFEAEVYSYSRSKGLFAGISLAGSSINFDKASNKSFYGGDTLSKDIFEGNNSGDQNVITLRSEMKKLVDGSKE